MTTIVKSASSSLHVAGGYICMVRTAVANVNANDLGIEASIFLDEVSQRLFLAESLGSSCNLTTQGMYF